MHATQDIAYDLVVLGAGPGGYTCALRAAALGLGRVALVERDRPGGTCLNVGCIPSKALLAAAAAVRGAAELAALGASVDLSGLDFGRATAAARSRAQLLVKGLEAQFTRAGIEVLSAAGRLDGPGRVVLADGRALDAKRVVLAPGSRPRPLPGIPFDGTRVLSSTDFLALTAMPARLVVLGSGAVGVELAQVAAAFGARVTVVEALPRLLPVADREVSEVLARRFRRTGIETRVGRRAAALVAGDTGVSITLEDAGGTREELAADAVLVAIGREPATDGIGLETCGLAAERGFIPVGDGWQTAAPGVWALGDAVRGPQLAHAAARAGELVAERQAGLTVPGTLDPDLVPAAVYTDPEAAWFGPTEEEAAAAGRAFRKVVFQYRGIGKAVAVGAPDGFVKLLVDGDGKLVAAHLAGAEATELVHELLVARVAGLTVAELGAVVHAHPTFAEAVREAALAAAHGD